MMFDYHNAMSVREYTECKDADRREEFEKHVFENVWYKFVEHLPSEEDWYEDLGCNSIDVWYYGDNDEILCRTEELAEMIADILESISGERMAHTGYYDPEEDEKDDCVDGRTGWYYVDWD